MQIIGPVKFFFACQIQAVPPSLPNAVPQSIDFGNICQKGGPFPFATASVFVRPAQVTSPIIAMRDTG